MRDCPRCGGPMPPHPGALSRADNTTEVCPACGNAEAMIAFAANASANMRYALERGDRYAGWVHPPKEGTDV